MPFKAFQKKIESFSLIQNKDLSYVDCIGYTFAIENKIKFLTGDMQFKDMQNVEFVK